MLNEDFKIKYDIENKLVFIAWDFHEIEYSSKRDNPYGSPIFEFEGGWCSVSVNLKGNIFKLFIRYEGHYYKSVVDNKFGVEIITFSNFQEVKKVDGKWTTI